MATAIYTIDHLKVGPEISRMFAIESRLPIVHGYIVISQIKVLYVRTIVSEQRWREVVTCQKKPGVRDVFPS